MWSNASMRFWRWYTFLVIVGSIVAGTINWWPRQPMWSRKMDACVIVGYLKNGTQIMLPQHQDKPSYVIYDVETGAEIRRITPEYRTGWRFTAIEIVPGSDQLFVAWTDLEQGTAANGETETSEQRPMVYQILDSTTGKSIAGPFTSYYWSAKFSPDGKYFWSKNQTIDQTLLAGFDLVETHTGKVLFEARGSVKGEPHYSIAFAPDSSAVAMLWRSGNILANMQFKAEVLELPSAKSLHQFTLPTDPRISVWGWLQSWTDRLYIAAQFFSTTPGYSVPSFSFDMTDKKLSDMRLEPLREEYTRMTEYYLTRTDAGDKLVEITFGDQQPSSKVLLWLESIAKKIGLSLRTPHGLVRLSVKTIDKATGQTLSQLSAPDLVSLYYKLSPEGTRLANWQPGKGLLLMWNTQPTPRWPWALGSALLVVLLLQYLRYRFTRTATSAGTPCSPAS